MPDRYQESHIRQIAYFANLSEPVFQKVAQAFVARRYNAGEIIFAENETTRGMHIFIDGQAVLLTVAPNGGRQQIGLVRSGQAINEQAIFSDGVQTATLQAVQPVTALFLTRQALMNLIAYDPEVAQAFGYASNTKRATTTMEGAQLPGKDFKTQRQNETVLLLTRRHWWAYARWAWLPLLLFFGAMALAFGINLGPLRWVVLLLGTVIPGTILVYLYAEWRNDSIIITDQRIIRITHTILTFTEVVNELAIESVQEANAEIPGLDPFALLFRYGYVEIKTAGREGNFMLDFVPNPEGIQELILQDQLQRVEQLNEREKQEMRAEVDRWLYAPRGTNPQSGSSASVSVGGANESKIQRLWSSGDGPRSPFVTSFPTDEGGQVYRKHWIIWMRRTTMPSFVIAASLFAALILLLLQPSGGLGVIGLAATMVSLLIGVLWFYFADWDWRHDYYLLTDTHINIIYQRPLWLQNENDQILLKQVDNVVAESRGIMQRLLGFGDVRLALVGADEFKLFDDVGDPLAVQGEISRRQARMRQREEDAAEEQQRAILGEYFQLYHEAINSNASYTPPQAAGAPQQPPANPQPNYPYQQARPQQQQPTYPPAANYEQAAFNSQQANYPQQNAQPQRYMPQSGTNYAPNQSTSAGNAQRPARPTISNGRRFQPSQPATPTGYPQNPAYPQPNQPPAPPPQQTNPPPPPRGNGSNRPERFPRQRPPSPPE